MIGESLKLLKSLLDRARSRAGDESGFTIIELMAALVIIAVGFFALAGALGAGSRYLVQSKRRQAASEKATAFIEHLRNVPYDELGLLDYPTKSTDEKDPDFYVSEDGLGYDYKGDGVYEPIIAGGSVEHFTEETVGTTRLNMYRYVTWVDDPLMSGTEDYKRATIVGTYLAEGAAGTTRAVQMSAIVTPGSVTVTSGSQAGAQQGIASTPTATPSPQPSSGSCAGDTTGPTGSFTLLSGSGAADGFTSSGTVTIQLAPSDGCTPITVNLSENNVAYGESITYDAVNPTVTRTLSSGDGTKNIWARFTDGAGNVTIVGPQTITRDSTKPGVPGTLTRVLNCDANYRTATLTWGQASDTNWLGYRLYRSIDNGAWTVIKTTAQQTTNDVHSKVLDSVRFYVTGYDKAGNESAATNTISLARVECS